MTNSKTRLYTVSVASTSFTVEAYFDEQGDSPAIRFGYEQEGRKYKGGIKFTRVTATRRRAERCCTPWHIDGAYDTLVEVEHSDWVAELRADMHERWRDAWNMHHFLVYFDSTGCFEIIAESWAALPDEPVS
ncbi:MAG: hypothetical protein SFZ23_09180 [Planctomycetota bacterium]|nr:hypothetical protein [Planctomycetota bacterium]